MQRDKAGLAGYVVRRCCTAQVARMVLKYWLAHAKLHAYTRTPQEQRFKHFKPVPTGNGRVLAGSLNPRLDRKCMFNR